MSELKTNSVSLTEIISFIKNTQQTGRLLVKSGGASSRLFFEKGHLIGAQNDTSNGDDVVYQLLGAKEATFQFEKSEEPGPQTIDTLQELLILATLGLVPVAEPPNKEDDTLTLPDLSHTPADRPEIKPRELTALSETSEAEPSRLPPRLDLLAQRPKFKRRSTVLLPGGRPVPLSREFQQLDTNRLTSLVPILEIDFFSGYLIWEGEATGSLLFYEGKVIDVFWSDNNSTNLDLALRGLIERGNVDGPTNAALYALDRAFIIAYASLSFGEALQEGVSTATMPFSRLKATLSQSKHTGALRLTNDSATGYLFFHEGIPLGNYMVLEGLLEPSYKQVEQLAIQPSTLIDVYTSPTPDRLRVMAERPKTLTEINTELCEVAKQVLGPKAQKVLNILEGVNQTPEDIRSACERAKRVTKIFIDRLKFEELTRKMDQVLVQLD